MGEDCMVTSEAGYSEEVENDNNNTAVTVK